MTEPLVIDANTGASLKVGQRLSNVNGEFIVDALDVGLTRGFAVVRRNEHFREVRETHEWKGSHFDVVHTEPLDPPQWGAPLRVPLVVRWTHPSYFLRRVAFFPS